MTSLVPYTSDVPAFSADWLLDPAEIAQRIGGTDFVPRGLRDNPAAITAALLYGQEIGLGRMASLATISVIDGRPSLSAEAQRALILAAGHEVWVDESTASRCIMAGRRHGSQQVTRITWTLDDAKRAGLAGRNAWRTYPRQMLMARASAELARAVFPDVTHGLAALEEVAEDGGGGAAASPQPPEDQPTTRRRRRRVVEAAPEPAPDFPPDVETPPAPEPLASRRADAESDVLAVDGPPAAAGDLPQELGTPDAQESDRTEPEDRSEGWLLRAVNDDPEARDEVGPAPASRAQLRHVFVLMRGVGLGGEDQRDQRLAYSSKVIQRPLETSADLTQSEAHALIEDLLSIADLPHGDERDARLSA